MMCALKKCGYAIFIGFLLCLQSNAASCKEDKTGKTLDPVTASDVSAIPKEQFQWNEHSKLSWDDFKGVVNASSEESAAATHCGIGFKTVTSTANKPQVVVYNIFYTNKSWVRSDAKIPSILDHEQGHFDLCEIYTRKLRARMENFDFGAPDIMQALMNIYSEVNGEYELRQKAYEEETIHGTNMPQQKKWRETISRELM